jgi:hypothetical protein
MGIKPRRTNNNQTMLEIGACNGRGKENKGDNAIG